MRYNVVVSRKNGKVKKHKICGVIEKKKNARGGRMEKSGIKFGVR